MLGTVGHFEGHGGGLQSAKSKRYVVRSSAAGQRGMLGR